MSEIADQQYLLQSQYKTSDRLDTRIQLHERFSTNPMPWQNWLFAQLDIADHSRILELGAGTAQLWLQNIQRIPPDWQITLSDFSAGMQEAARQNLGTHASRFQFATFDAQSIPYANDTFDYVIANHMLYHVPDRAQAFAEIRRVLQPAGSFYAATNGQQHLLEIQQLCEQAGIAEGGIRSQSTTRAFTLQNGLMQLAPYFTEIEVRTFPGDLWVTETEPLAAFILSMLPAEKVSAAQVQVLRTIIARKIAEQGGVQITKETGLLIASGNTDFTRQAEV